MKKIFLTIAIGISILSCANDSEDDLMNPSPLPDTVTYVNDVKSIIDNNCTSCHNNPPVNGAPNALVTYLQVKDAVLNKNLIGRITGASGALMPQGGPKLPQNVIDIIIQWETDGLLE